KMSIAAVPWTSPICDEFHRLHYSFGIHRRLKSLFSSVYHPVITGDFAQCQKCTWHGPWRVGPYSAYLKAGVLQRWLVVEVVANLAVLGKQKRGPGSQRCEPLGV